MKIRELKEKCENLRKNGAKDVQYMMFQLKDMEELVREAEAGGVKREERTETKPAESRPVWKNPANDGKKENKNQPVRQPDIPQLSTVRESADVHKEEA